MDKSKAIGLLKAYVIGCLGDEESTALKSFMEESEDFPWKELGEWQNVSALYASSLKLEAPEPELKDKVARDLYRLKDEIIAKQKAREAKQVVVEEDTETIEEEKEEEIDMDEKEEEIVFEEKDEEIILEEKEEEIDLEEKNEEFLEEPELEITDIEPVGKKVDAGKKDIIFKDPGFTQFSRDHERTLDIADETPPPVKESVITRPFLDDDKLEKKLKEYVKNFYAEEIESVNAAIKRNFLISVILSVVAIIVAIGVYFMLSS